MHDLEIRNIVCVSKVSRSPTARNMQCDLLLTLQSIGGPHGILCYSKDSHGYNPECIVIKASELMA
jgi:hypothetical protein